MCAHCEKWGSASLVIMTGISIWDQLEVLCVLCVLLPFLFLMLAVAIWSVVPLPKSQGEYAFQCEGSENPSFSRPPFLSCLLEYMGTALGAPLAKGLLVIWGKGHNLPMGSGVSRSGQAWVGPSALHPQPLHWKSTEQLLSLSPTVWNHKLSTSFCPMIGLLELTPLTLLLDSETLAWHPELKITMAKPQGPDLSISSE